jgi:cell division protein FtsB
MSKFLLIALFLLSTTLGAYYLVPKYQENQNLKIQLDQAQFQLLAQRAEIDKRRQLRDDLHRSPTAIAKVAREKFRLCKFGERVYKFIDEDKLRATLKK